MQLFCLVVPSYKEGSDCTHPPTQNIHSYNRQHHSHNNDNHRRVTTTRAGVIWLSEQVSGESAYVGRGGTSTDFAIALKLVSKVPPLDRGEDSAMESGKHTSEGERRSGLCPLSPFVCSLGGCGALWCVPDADHPVCHANNDIIRSPYSHYLDARSVAVVWETDSSSCSSKQPKSGENQIDAGRISNQGEGAINKIGLGSACTKNTKEEDRGQLHCCSGRIRSLRTKVSNAVLCLQKGCALLAVLPSSSW
jgi:hypothetical protein